jgi:molybdopterin converting factor subunit 1
MNTQRTMSVRVLFFATLRDKAKTREAEVELPVGADAAALKACLARQYPALQPAMAQAIVAVDRQYVSPETVIPEGAEIALFPPVSGG